MFTDSLNYLPLYFVPLLAFLGLHFWRRHNRARQDHATLKEAVEAGLTEPASLHPVVDINRCIGSGSCVNACPEGALGIIRGKAQLINAAACIGHGACASACAFDAISLVFGTERRGIDIPLVHPSFETNVPGIFIAGELGGMGLVRKAVEQGVQAMESVAKGKRYEGAAEGYDVVVVGAGPAGLAAGVSALRKGLRYCLVDQEDSLGGTIYHYPRNKVVMTDAIRLPGFDSVPPGEIGKESLLKYWHGVVKRSGLKIEYKQQLLRIEKEGNGFVVHTTNKALRCQNVLLSIGRRGTPRKLDVPGEELPKVVYRLIDAEQYRGQKVLVVGGGDSALEAALALAGQPDTDVTLSYRSAAFNRIKTKNRIAIEQARSNGAVRLLLESNVKSISKKSVSLIMHDQTMELANDCVVVCAGGVLPTDLLRDTGIMIETKFGTA
ncbi:NAD(P)-binding domain-containing protein [Uliginosibacterium gangwonense]|uniref:NAD(P)-binding domain-containing protein n=1 Tax=Uliginosibacterium gangwonense TaxID=392736 RepID=UPI000367D2DF|nr:NAD(P)-binding domain-containing protein [Uliginosibacterium gangwonense]